MIDFRLTEEHLAVEKMVREFAAREIAPRIKELDEKGETDLTILRKENV